MNKNLIVSDQFSSAKVFWFIFFCILPFVSVNLLLDHDMGPKTICLLFMTIYLLFFTWKNKFDFYNRKLIVLFFTLILFFVAYTFASSCKALNKSEGISDWINLNYIFIFLFGLCFSGIINLKFIFRFVPYTVFVLFIISIFQIVNSIIEFKSFYIDYRIAATLGNKNFLSETLVLLLPFTLSAGIIEIKMVKRLNVIATAIILILVFLLQTTSAWISLFLTSAIFIPSYLLLFRKNTAVTLKFTRRRIISILTLIILVCFVSIQILNKYSAFDNLKNKISYTKEIIDSDLTKLTSEESGKNVNSVFERIFLWRNTVKLAAENKLTGIGLSNWKIMWPKYGVGGAYFLNSGVMHYEHPHNEFLLFLSENGLLGLIIFVAIFTLIIIYGFRLIKFKNDESDKVIILLMLGGIVSFIVLSLFGYPFHRPYSVAVLMIMIAVIITKGRTKNIKRALPIASKPAIIACVILTFFIFNVAVARLQGEYFMNKALQEQSRGRFTRMSEDTRKAENNYFKFDLTGTPLNWYRGFALHYSGSDSSLYYFKLADEQNPYHIQTISDIGAILENKGSHMEAISYFNRALAIIPGYKEARFNLSIAYYHLNRPEDALREINKAYVTGDTYDIALKEVLRLNAENIYNTVKAKDLNGKFRNCINDVLFLKKLNQEAMERNVSFEKMLLDSCLNFN